MSVEPAPTLVRRGALVGILAIYATVSIVGITWGLPSRKIDKYLFGDGEVWSGEKIHRLAGAGGKFSPARGADVDADPLRSRSVASAPGSDQTLPISLTATDEDIAKILLRYRLYTYQPDEMITMMALAGMRPSRLDLDPRLYQYGGLFIYPVGALIKLCGLLGLINVRSDVVFYLDHPDEFGKFYIVARAYSAAWGLLGIVLVYAIANRLVPAASADERAPHRAGLLASLLFALMPVVVCMSHEGKPHLPGAVLMLAAVYFAMRFGSTQAKRDFAWLCVSCGAAVGMVLSSWPILTLIPLVAFLSAPPSANRRKHFLHNTIRGTAIALGVYLLANPYVLANTLFSRDVLRSNFGNSLAMYEIARVGEGFLRVVELTIEGTSPPVAIVGVVGLMVAAIRRDRKALPLIAVAVVFLLQFVLIGAGKPAEYGRFGIFTNTALAIGGACTLASLRRAWLRWPVTALLTLWVGFGGLTYMQNFWLDATGQGSRTQLAADIERSGAGRTIVIPAEPAPYSLPPVAFTTTPVILVPEASARGAAEGSWRFIRPVDRRTGSSPNSPADVQGRVVSGAAGRETPISWANKPFLVETAAR